MLSARLVFLLGFGTVLAATASCGVGSAQDHGLEHKDAGGAGGTGNSGGVGTGGSAAGGTGGIVLTGGSAGDLTGAGGTAPDCVPPVGPFCGDGMVNQTTETCDDGNALPGDGCTGTCTTEPFFDCPVTGGVCTSTLRCGDGVRSPGEACDDANVEPNDGCPADCLSVDPGFYCPVPGMPCMRSEGACGDSKVQPGETCDDGNMADADGCTALCRVEPGWRCTQPGKPCILVPICGNGKLEGPEACDDGNMASDDGCSSTCHVEIGWVCAMAGSPCRKTVCGDGKVEGSECCDDSNVIAQDGCTAECHCEPTCPATGACTPKCGNGIVEGSEQCDDGNAAAGDGCSATCQPEAGFECETPPCTLVNGQCVVIVPVTFRDFNAHAGTGGHPDFQPGFNSPGGVQGLVQEMLDADGKPVQTTGLSQQKLTDAYLHGQGPFAQWYRDGSPSGGPVPGQIILYDNGKGGFVNRWGANGEQWQANPQTLDYGTPTAGLQAGLGCSNPDYPNQGCTPGPGQQCYDPCTPWNSTAQACCADVPTATGFDGNPLFFPLDGSGKGILTEPRSEGKVPSQYGWNGWPWEHVVATALGITSRATATATFPSTMHNYSFTTEVKYWFKYDATKPATLEFTGDDDVWVFLNGHLAVDLGGWHVPLNGTLTINGNTINSVSATTANDAGVTLTSVTKNGTATTYGLTDGNVYQIKIFHAERQVEGSSFKLTLSGFSMIPSQCTEICGDGIVTVSEECDDGAENSDATCGACTSQCKFGARCGDGITQTECEEQCDDGVNVGGYNQCDVGCVPAARCGDGEVQADFGEQCDDGPNNGMPGGCTANCGVPGFCGDAAVQAPETCDDGVNDNRYGGCSMDCQYGPRCGDAVTQADAGEECDLGDGNSDAYGGCTKQCKIGAHCGDGIIQAPEQCDAGSGDMMGMAPPPMTTDPLCTDLNSVCTEQCRIEVKNAK